MPVQTGIFRTREPGKAAIEGALRGLRPYQECGALRPFDSTRWL